MGAYMSEENATLDMKVDSSTLKMKAAHSSATDHAPYWPYGSELSSLNLSGF
jgi:hypothetical protein